MASNGVALNRYAELAAELEAIAKDPPSELLQDDQLRKRLLLASQAIVPQIEAPGESFLRVIYTVRSFVLIQMDPILTMIGSHANLWLQGLESIFICSKCLAIANSRLILQTS